MRLANYPIVIGILLASSSAALERQDPGWNSATGAEQYERLMCRDHDQDWGNVEGHLAPRLLA